MKTKIVFDPLSPCGLTFEQVKRVAGVYRPTAIPFSEGRVIIAPGGYFGFYLNTSGMVEQLRPEVWSTEIFIKVPGEQVTITFTND